MLNRLFKTRSIISVVFVITAIFGIVVTQTMQASNTLTTPVTLELKPGATVRTLASQLQQHNLLNSSNLFVIWARISGKASRLQAGEYIIKPGENLAELLDNVVRGRVKQYSLTLVEGWNFKQFMQATNEHKAINHQLTGLSNNEIMSALGLDGTHPEGMFFPDTYYIHKNITDIEVLQRAYQVMQRTLEQAWDKREKNLPFKNAYEALILASIVEKESAVADERPVIAGVFINRLRKKMRLQTDPTVIYGMGDTYKGDIRFRDLRKDTPYNTYTRRGLTPTPIAMPGTGAINAVMHPAETQHLYFVAINDGSGRHKFSATLEEHEKAVDKYQRKK